MVTKTHSLKKRSVVSFSSQKMQISMISIGSLFVEKTGHPVDIIEAILDQSTPPDTLRTEN